MSSDAIKLNSNLKCEVHTQLLKPQNENENDKLLQEIVLRMSERPRILEILEAFRKIQPFLESTSIVRFRFVDIVNEQNENSTHNMKTIVESFLTSNYDQTHSILINDIFIELESNKQPTFLESASGKIYNAEDEDTFEEPCEFDEIFYWGFRQWCIFVLFYVSFIIFVAQFIPSSYSFNLFKL
ncbi:7171_t:CDS:1 [Ambispora gerdemannii]|uniref:7171_t:CDS:1 n=1 Tax=Ambispora gerdemannii TaxID=144530 RepID=A0A9N8ZK40_9GLOM|nr:7171_t:CDS:1 [Ambispora gerdemannii]